MEYGSHDTSAKFRYEPAKNLRKHALSRLRPMYAFTL